MITIQTLTERDIPQCLEIYKYYVEKTTATFEEDSPSLPDFTERVCRIRNHYPFVAAKDGDLTIGYAYLDTFNSRSAYRKSADLSIYLDRTATGMGTGRLLLNRLISECPSYGIRNIISIVCEENIASRVFHERNGFVLCGKLTDIGEKFGRSLSVLYYERSL